jgi:hypothetical protein
MPKTPDELALVRRYVVWSEHPGGQRYVNLLGTNPLREDEPDRDAFIAALAEDARQISDNDLTRLLEFEWRARLTASWLIGLDQKLGTAHAQRFLVPGGLWQRSVFAERDPLASQRTAERLSQFADRVMATST